MNTVLAALVNGILISAGLAFVVWAALRVTPRNSLNAATRYAIWWAVFAVTICLPASYFRDVRTTPVISPAIPMSAAPRVQTRIRIVPPSSAINTVPPALSNLARIHFPLAIPASNWPARILAIWLLAVGLMVIRLLASAVILERRKARASEPPPTLAARVAQWITTCGGTNRRIRLDISYEISVPLVSGLRRPSILLPERLLDQLSEQELEQIGIHEAAHLVRYDDYALAIQRVVQAMFALHPVVHWISRRIDLEREIACDDFVIAASNNPQPYAACLARVVELSGGIRSTPVAAAAAEDNSHLARRVEMLLDRKRYTAPRLLGVRLAFALTCITAFALGAIQIPRVLSFSAAQRNETLTPARVARPVPPLVAQTPTPTLPAIRPTPAIPAQPSTPATPSVPATPAIPSVPATPAIPAVPATPAIPAVPASPVSPTVFIPVDVRDPLGRFVTGIHQDSFRIEEDGVEQVITQLTGSDDPADLFVLVGSELVPDPELRSLLAERIPLTAAGSVVTVAGRLSPEATLPDALLTLRNRLPQPSSRQAVLIITNSGAGARPPVGAGMDIPIYIVDVTNSGPNALLSEFAARTGGDYVVVTRQQDVADKLAKVVIAIRNMYFLGYTPRNTARDGGYRSVQVTLNAPRGLPPLTARTPPGYLVPTR